ncbi:ArnT family glycosyltransferase [Neorhizobium galegae]|uniref:ArnT family glycosyltransferase n=1 Tax=Neorhizobium galegae TaxID=399 RepID=UPI00210533C5|nr:glycosyltransferase family 39 protein [Neorhizobium galegae]MCQ1833801.1 glycosyltransferase family 39 protein [Neorhizobium galegae]
MRRISDALARRPDLILWLIAAYYVLAVILRVLRSEALESDEAEQLYQSQFLLMGYGRQPPFYNWLQYGVVQLIGPSVLAVALVKNLLLFLTCAVYGLAARVLLKDRRLVAIAMIGVIAMPAVSVMAQRDLTHAIATLFAVALFFYGFLKTLTRPTLWTYLLTGIAVGFGLIAKYNFVIVPVAAILAILPEPELRKRILDWRLIPALALTAVICLPHGLWMFGNLSEATAGTIKAMREDASGNPILDRLSGIGTLFVAILTGGLPVLAFFLIAFRQPLIDAWQATNQWTRVIGRTLAICLIAVGLIGLGFGATSISEKWLSPFLVLLPLYLCLKLDAAKAETSRSIPRLLFPVAVLALGFVVYIALGNVIGPMFGDYTKENLPSGPFVEQVVAERPGAKPAYVMTDDPYLAASSRLELPQARVLLQSFGQTPPLGEAERRQRGLIIWQGGGKTLDALKPYLRANGIAAEGLAPATKVVPYLFSGGRDSVTFGYAWVEPVK